ncbi:Hypothetical predicted protein [Octopus vulgaris]|uniref:Uncharacterized protein n=1 Tax=Octopus vulgaris TaxID=6645 RepID=A0AA36EZ31_OCTVU|nr:Hypothetical predicted protein [Octopus vulgaris]
MCPLPEPVCEVRDNWRHTLRAKVLNTISPSHVPSESPSFQSWHCQCRHIERIKIMAATMMAIVAVVFSHTGEDVWETTLRVIKLLCY